MSSPSSNDATMGGDPFDDDAFVAKFDPAGNYIWSDNSFGALGEQRVTGIVAAPSARCYVQRIKPERSISAAEALRVTASRSPLRLGQARRAA